MSPTPSYRGRFAPSPTGPLHLGSLLAALGSWLLARQAGGTWLVRIEDLDPPREVPGAAALQLSTLAAFGLRSDEAVVYQSTRSALYQAALDQLLGQGDAFPCRCSRRDLEPFGGVHRRCVAKPSGQHEAIRLRVPDGETCFVDLLQGRLCQDVGREVGDVVIRRADGFWAYQLAMVVDDAQQGITDVVRGMDLVDSTQRQVLLQRFLGLPTPRHLHLPLVTDAGGAKLSKSLAALPVDPGDPMPALARVWVLLGQDPARIALHGSADAVLQRMASSFDASALPRGPVARVITPP
ncbi:tRNA glutamyl-Q(34) synthetase GluQRS [Alkalisalibacterium limincola]|uniref:Glutamyl-Q tRNA(Asp) synthetase n=1 Tax=Alkalisalibacterium limincola TaxID=2699169 RepID=A0A5C8KYD5_9GAMM|nr:tRNA glutamyl-Q(34) synthetase GluQRS [Alkalisalibacterium limincola]TXK65827.1 tRNA glutamyl-Q(34) synthetase GluQRS [Alkalisalibacterium limincola]